MISINRQPMPSHQRRRILASLLAGICFPAHVLGAHVNYARRDTVRMWAAEFSESHQIDFNWVLTVLRKARYLEVAHKIMSRPRQTASSTPKNWLAHKSRFLTTERIQLGIRFMNTFENALMHAHAKWQIPPEIITAIIGIETLYGQKMGRFPVIDALCTLSFDYTRRATFFRNELEAFLLWCHLTERNPLSIRGSFAGAIGMCQFMPSNILKFGFDFDNDGTVDIIHSAPDAIGSVANYLSHIGWDSDLPIAFPCEANNRIARDLNCGGINTNTTVQNALDAGLTSTNPFTVKVDTPVLLVDLPVKGPTLWRLATQNFATLLHYNQSYFYAESVRELASVIATHVANNKNAADTSAASMN